MANKQCVLLFMVSLVSATRVKLHTAIQQTANDGKEDGTITFKLIWPHAAKSSVVVRGSWDGWTSDIPLKKQENGVWAETIKLPFEERVWEYKFIVDGKWTHDKDRPTNGSWRRPNNVLNNGVTCTCPDSVSYCNSGLARELMKNISNAERVKVMKDFPLAELFSAPNHAHVRDPRAVLKIWKGLLESQSEIEAEYRSGWEKIRTIWMDIHVADNKMCHVEIRDGNHRAAALAQAGLVTGKDTIGKFDPTGKFFKVSVNGQFSWDRNEAIGTPYSAWPRAIPKQAFKNTDCEPFAYRYNGGNATVSEYFTSAHDCLPPSSKGVKIGVVFRNAAQSAPKEYQSVLDEVDAKAAYWNRVKEHLAGTAPTKTGWFFNLFGGE